MTCVCIYIIGVCIYAYTYIYIYISLYIYICIHIHIHMIYRPPTASRGQAGSLCVISRSVKDSLREHPLRSERCGEDRHGPCARMTRTNREVWTMISRSVRWRCTHDSTYTLPLYAWSLSLSLSLSTYIYIYIYVHVSHSLSLYIYMYTSNLYIHAYTCIYVYDVKPRDAAEVCGYLPFEATSAENNLDQPRWLHKYTCNFMCMYMYMYVYVHICIYTYIYI